jgi:hypothetical protein
MVKSISIAVGLTLIFIVLLNVVNGYHVNRFFPSGITSNLKSSSNFKSYLRSLKLSLKSSLKAEDGIVRKEKKYIVVTGGVISGIGKGVTASSIGVILKMMNLRPTAIKIDPYLNIDAGESYKN